MACRLLEGQSDQARSSQRSSQPSTGPGFHDPMELVTLRSPFLNLASPARGGLIDDGLVGT
jgi:hypothetical protein